MSRSLSDDLVNRQLFLIVTKPVARWQFLAGKWMGITGLNVMFLCAAGVTAYGMVHYIMRTHPPLDDRFDKQELTNEVLVARHARPLRRPDFSRDIDAEFERNREEGLYDAVPDFDPQAEKARLANKYSARWRVVGPGEGRIFYFEQVLVDRNRQPYIQLRYMADVSNYAPDEIFRATWIFGDRARGTPERRADVRHMVGRYHIVRVAADVVAPDGTLKVTFLNRNPFADEPDFRNVIDFKPSEPVEVLFIVGSFEGNLVRLLILMMCKLMFLAALAILAASIFSFPVACLCALTVYVFAGAQQFLLDSLDFLSDDYATMFSSAQEFFAQLLIFLFQAVCFVVPDFSRYDAVESLVSGRNVGLVWVLQAVFELALLKTFIVLGLAMLLFQRREVAEVSV
jgi:hypothetical protein